jgi:hypothetical protein
VIHVVRGRARTRWGDQLEFCGPPPAKGSRERNLRRVQFRRRQPRIAPAKNRSAANVGRKSNAIDQQSVDGRACDSGDRREQQGSQIVRLQTSVVKCEAERRLPQFLCDLDPDVIGQALGRDGRTSSYIRDS